jgi:K+-sensing histidine kinase KdpD
LNYIRLIKDTTRAGTDLITDLLDVTSLEEKQFEPTLSPVNIQELLQSKMDTLTITALAKNIQLEVKNEVESIISTDSAYLNRILDNLISNALKFSTSGTRVLVKVSLQNSLLALSIKDEGPGFSVADKKSMYQKFKKLTARPTASESSNGLGLAIVKILVDRLKGEINLITEPSKGSEFIVKLPV